MTINYHNKKFKAIANSEHGEVAEGLIFLYQQAGNLISCTYEGGEIIKGHLIGNVDSNGVIEMSYHQVNRKGELKHGICTSTPEVLKNGKIRLHESWQWTSGNKEKGTSTLDEI